MAITAPNILVVDDDLGICQTVSDILAISGFRVTYALDGYRAIESYQQQEFDLVLMDMRMPGLNGLETYRELKSINPSVKVIIMTAYSMEDILTDAKNEGVLSIINKPFRMQGLIESITSITSSDA
jgi:CheY-like chemotaxis protein